MLGRASSSLEALSTKNTWLLTGKLVEMKRHEEMEMRACCVPAGKALEEIGECWAALQARWVLEPWLQQQEQQEPVMLLAPAQVLVVALRGPPTRCMRREPQL